MAARLIVVHVSELHSSAEILILEKYENNCNLIKIVVRQSEIIDQKVLRLS